MNIGINSLGSHYLGGGINQLRQAENIFRIILTQGLNRQIRRMCAELGYRVVTLKRVRIMNIHLGKLNTGDFRRVTPQELEELEWQLEQARMEREEADLPAEQDE